MTAPAARVERVVASVCADAVTTAGVAGIVLLDAATPEGGLLAGWLERALGADRVWRAGAQTGNVHGDGARDDALMAHPANKTALLLGGRLPRVDLLPLGDVWASQVEVLAGGWSAGEPVTALAARAGGVAAVDSGLQRLVEERRDVATALDGLTDDVAAELLRLYEAGRYYRQRPRLTPKLTARTLGIDLFD